MGFLGILFGIFLIIGLLGLYFLDKSKKSDDTWMFFGIISGIIGIIGATFCGCVLCTNIYNYYMRNYDKQNEQFKRTALIRLLDEHYDPDNLNKALQFNVKQKMASNYNNSTMFVCWTDCYSVDTIPIPPRMLKFDLNKILNDRIKFYDNLATERDSRNISKEDYTKKKLELKQIESIKKELDSIPDEPNTINEFILKYEDILP